MPKMCSMAWLGLGLHKIYNQSRNLKTHFYIFGWCGSAEALDNHLTSIQRDHELKSQIEERKIKSDAAHEEAKRKEKALQEERLRQESARADHMPEHF